VRRADGVGCVAGAPGRLIHSILSRAYGLPIFLLKGSRPVLSSKIWAFARIKYY